MFSQAITITLNYVLNKPNAFIVFQLQPIVKFLMYNTNINEALCKKGNMACLKPCLSWTKSTEFVFPPLSQRRIRFPPRDYKGDREGIPHVHPIP